MGKQTRIAHAFHKKYFMAQKKSSPEVFPKSLPDGVWEQPRYASAVFAEHPHPLAKAVGAVNFALRKPCCPEMAGNRSSLKSLLHQFSDNSKNSG